jgi:hypothetical protein
MQSSAQYMRRDAAAKYLQDTYGFGAARTLAKGAVTGDSPEFHKAGRIVLYTREALDKWALAKIGAPRTSTSNEHPLNKDVPAPGEAAPRGRPPKSHAANIAQEA